MLVEEGDAEVQAGFDQIGFEADRGGELVEGGGVIRGS
jgi:hypothetical protein